MSRFVATTKQAVNNTAPCNSGMSRIITDLIVIDAMPGKLNTCSTASDRLNTTASRNPMTVTIGMRALRNAYLLTTCHSGMPVAWAARM